MGFNKVPWTNIHNINLDWIIKTVEECKKKVDDFISQDFETKTFVTENRKLSETGDFTGSIQGVPSQSVLANIDSNNDKIEFLTDQFEDGATGLVIDGGNYNDTEIDKMYDGGVW